MNGGGSRRGKYNKFESIYFTLTFLPRIFRNLFQFSWAAVSSNVVGFVAIFNEIMKHIQFGLAKGILVYVADLRTTAFVDGDVFVLAGDNPRQQDFCNCGQSSTEHWCRKCLGAKSHPTSSVLRDYDVTREIVSILRDKNEVATGSIDINTGVKDNGVADLRNHPHLDPHRDTIIEILHTILLGLVKYCVKETVAKLNNQQKAVFMALLQADTFSGFKERLNGNPIANWKSYAGGDFKKLCQIMPYLLVGCKASENLVDAWVIVSELAKYAHKLSFTPKLAVNHPEAVREAVKIVLSIFPSLKTKFKMHVISEHLVTDFFLLGLLVNGSTERFEAINKIMRAFYHSTNLKSPGRDIAIGTARFMTALFIILGGQCLVGDCIEMVCPKVKNLQSHPAFKHLEIFVDPVDGPRQHCFKNENRDHNRNVITRLMEDYEHRPSLLHGFSVYFPHSQLAVIVADNDPILSQKIAVHTFRSFDCKFSRGVRGGDAILYLNQNNVRSYGFFLFGIELRGCSQVIHETSPDRCWVFLKPFSEISNLEERDLQTSSLILRLSDQDICVPLCNIQQAVHIVHDCSFHLCESRIGTKSSVRKEANVDTQALVVPHEGPRYLLNRFLFQSSPSDMCDEQFIILEPSDVKEFPPLLKLLMDKYETQANDESSTEVDDSSDFTFLDLDTLTVKELRQRLLNENLDSKGDRATLAEPLANFLESHPLDNDWVPNESEDSSDCEFDDDE
eukprot:Pompholyxophrys_punicea_v1_NODE_96_length_3522_cov_38.680127.p1 type:complete len:733 gc:universal NODE_96_length_3522_cov_38.680127:1254-3452(+)